MADVSGSGFGGRRPPGLLANAAKRKEGFVQLFLMAGVFMMSLRSLGQKHRLRDLADDTADLRCERDDLSLRARGLQDALRREADADSSGALASHLTLRPPPPRTSSALILLFSGFFFYDTYV